MTRDDLNVSEPAADPPPMCEWRVSYPVGTPLYETSCDGRKLWVPNKTGTCPSCGKSIKFKEPSHD